MMWSLNWLISLSTTLFVSTSLASIHCGEGTWGNHHALYVRNCGAGVARATVQNGPINLFDNNLLGDMQEFLLSLRPTENNNPPKVVIFESANPDFFIMHRDVNGIHPPLVDWKRNAIATYISITRLLQNITTTVFIAEINGRAFGAGAEVTTQMDMRFAGPGADVGFFENGFGLMPGGGGQQFLATLTNKARALQYILGCEQIDGRTGAEIGWFNEFYTETSALKNAVDKLAYRIAQFPEGNINATKAGLNWINPPMPILENDIAEFIDLDMRPDRPRLIEKFLRLSHNQSLSPMELAVPQNMIKLFDAGEEDSLVVQEL